MMNKTAIVIVKKILLSLPLALIFLILYNQLVILEEKNILSQLKEEHLVHLGYIEEATNNQFDNYYALLEFISDSIHIQMPPPLNTNLVDRENILPPPIDQENRILDELLSSLIRHQPRVEQIRLYTKEGELLSAVSQKYTLPTSFAFDEYDISKEALFEKIEQSEDGDIYLNPIIYKQSTSSEESHEKILMAKGVYRDYHLVAIALITIYAEQSFHLITQYFDEHPNAISYCVVDSKGIVLESSKKEIGVAAQNRSINLSTINPIIWDYLLKNREGSLIYNNSMYLVKSLLPLEEVTSFYKDSPHYFAIITGFNLDELDSIQSSFLLRNGPLRYVFALLIILGYVIISLLFYFRKNDQELLTVSNIINEQSRDGVIIRKPDGNITFSNATIGVLTGFNEDEIISNLIEIELLDGTIFYKKAGKKCNNSIISQVTNYDDYAWVSGKNCYILSHLYMDSVYNNQSELLYYVQLISDPHNVVNDSFDSYAQNKKDIILPIDKFPIKKISFMAEEAPSLVLMYLKLTNLEELENQNTHSQHYQLGSSIRESLTTLLEDTDQLFQYTPDTFLLIFTTEPSMIHKKIIALNNLFTLPIDTGTARKPLTYMCGVSVYQKGKDFEVSSTISQARMALATQIHYSRQGALIYNDSVNKGLIRYYDILRKIPQALKNGDFKIYFQPIISTMTSRVIGAEALSRWTDSELGKISPDEFIPIFMQHQMEVSLALFVIEKTVTFISSLNLSPEEYFTVSINLGSAELFEENLINHLVTTLDVYNVDHSRLFIELTERTLLEDLPKANLILERLHKEGIHIAIDDFGTGFSSLNYIQSLDIDLIKIDRSFIKDYPSESEGKIIKAILTMAQEIEIKTLVEGIETQEQLDFIRKLKANAYQGFLVSKAIPLEEFIPFFHQQNLEK
jgi:EAL domain-containing protein (putative c-di-GMP-specific phosphodiesterase class I)/PAS domain-containing protein